MAFRKPVIIVGGGVGGLATCLCLRRAGISAYILESDERFNFKRVGVPLWSHALKVLDRLGVGSELRMHSLPTLKAEIYSLFSKPGRESLEASKEISKEGSQLPLPSPLILPSYHDDFVNFTPPNDIQDSDLLSKGLSLLASYPKKRPTLLGAFSLQDYSGGSANEALVLDRAELQQILLNALPPDVVWRNCKFESFTNKPDGVEVVIRKNDDKESKVVEAALLVGADGKRSQVRTQMGVTSDSFMRHSGFTQFQGVVDLDDILSSFDGSVQERLTTEIFPRFVAREIWGPSARFGFMTMSPGKLYWYASLKAKPGQVFLRPFRKYLIEKFGSSEERWPFECFHMIDRTDELSISRNGIYTWSGTGKEIRRLWLPVTCGRTALIGNAAYSFTNNIHEQTCLAIEDAYALAQSVAQYGLKDLTALDVYNRNRQKRRQEMRLVNTSKLNALFGPSSNSDHPDIFSKLSEWESAWMVWTRDRLMTRAITSQHWFHFLRAMGIYQSSDLPLTKPIL